MESQIEAWRRHLRRSPTTTDRDASDLEAHLRGEMAELERGGLAEDEAFMVALKRTAAVDPPTREFVLQHAERLWSQLAPQGREGAPDAVETAGPRTPWVALGLAVAAAIAMKVPASFGVPFDPDASLFYPKNVGFLVLPFVIAYFAWERPVPTGARAGLAAVMGLAALAVNVFPFSSESADTLTLTLIHLLVVLWFAVGVAYVGGWWPGNARRMDFIRFTGEFFIWYVLIALGGGVLTGLTLALFQAISVDVEPLVVDWIVPMGIAGAAVVATWLVESRQRVVGNIAPILARVFVPLFTLVLMAFVVTVAGTGRGIDVEREILITVDLLLVVVFGLLLYSISARDPGAAPGLMDWIQLALVITALLVDGLALAAIGGRISEFGFTPNRLAGLGLNLVLLGNLAGSAVLYLRFVRGRSPMVRLWGWQMGYLYVLAAWASIVAFAFPPLFRFR